LTTELAALVGANIPGNSGEGDKARFKKKRPDQTVGRGAGMLAGSSAAGRNAGSAMERSNNGHGADVARASRLIPRSTSPAAQRARHGRCHKSAGRNPDCALILFPDAAALQYRYTLGVITFFLKHAALQQ
jgi:hypothetical protein